MEESQQRWLQTNHEKDQEKEERNNLLQKARPLLLSLKMFLPFS